MNSEEGSIRSDIQVIHLVQSITVHQQGDALDSIPQALQVINNPIHCCFKGEGKRGSDFIILWQFSHFNMCEGCHLKCCKGSVSRNPLAQEWAVGIASNNHIW